MSSERVLRPNSPESKSDASPGGPGLKPRRPSLPAEQVDPEIEPGPPRNTPPDNPFDDVRTSSNE